MTDKLNRTTFYFKGQPVTAAGVLLYKKRDDEVHFLMMKAHKGLEDMGGKCEVCDKTLEHTIAREAVEESNNIFEEEYILNLLEKTNIKVYFPKSKYLVYICKTEIDWTIEEFDTIEYHTGWPRTVHWVSQSKLQFSDIHFRLRSKFFMKTVKGIKLI